MAIRLTSEQTFIISSAAAPLPAGDRKHFEQRVLAQLATVPEIGDGAVHRACREAQRACFTPPTMTEIAAEPQHRKP